MSRHRCYRILIVTLLLSLFAAACGGEASETPAKVTESASQVEEPAKEQEPAEAEEPPPTGEATILRVPLRDVPENAVVDTDEIRVSLQEGLISLHPGVNLDALSYEDGILVFTLSGTVTQALCMQLFEALGEPADCPADLAAGGAGPVGEDVAPRSSNELFDFSDFPAPDETLASQSVESLLPSIVLLQSTGGGGGQGTGFFITQDGYILTNAHVVEQSTGFNVILYDGRNFPGRIVGYVEGGGDRPDVGVVKIESDGLPVASLGDADSLSHGDPVISVGHPSGYGYWLAVGGRYIGEQGSNLVTSATNSPGSSGAPMINLNGEVVGLLWGEEGLSVDEVRPEVQSTVDILWSFDEFQSHRQLRPSTWGVTIEDAMRLATEIISRQANVRYQEFLPLPEYTIEDTSLAVSTFVDPLSIESFTEAIAVTILFEYPGYEVTEMTTDTEVVTVTFNELPPEEALTKILQFFADSATFVPGQELDLRASPSSAGSFPSPADDAQAVSVAQSAIPGVVSVDVIGAGAESGGIATGFLISPDGYILTNAHNVEGTPPLVITITLADGRVLPGELVGADRDQSPDVAVIKIEGNDLPTLALGDESALANGDSLISVGHPGGYGFWLVSGGEYLGIEGGDLVSSGPCSQGCSGSPVLNMDGLVVGLLFAGQTTLNLPVERTLDDVLWSNSEFWALAPHGIVAVPISQAMATANQIISSGGDVP